MEQTDLVRYVTQKLDEASIPYAIVGSYASAAYGEPRMTLDVDIVFDLQGHQIDELIEAFPAPDFYISRSAVLDAVNRRSQFNVIHPSSGNKIDFIVLQMDVMATEPIE